MSDDPARRHDVSHRPRPTDRRDETLDVLERVIMSRRSCLQLDTDRDVNATMIERLLALSTWSPNHHRTQPWRFAVFSHESRRSLGDALADSLAASGAPTAKVEKTRTKYLRAPHVIAFGSVAGDDALTTAENRDATATAVQTFLLAATAARLATFWGSAAIPDDPGLLALCGFPLETHVVALVYLGHQTGTCVPPERDAPVISWVEAS